MNAGWFEIAAVAVAVAMALGILLARVSFSHERRLRRAASSGYYQRDLVRYGPDGVGGGEEADEVRDRILAPTFVVPPRGRRTGGRADEGPRSKAGRHRSSGRRALYGTVDPVANLLPAFDSETARRRRPPDVPSSDSPDDAQAPGAPEAVAVSSAAEHPTEEIPPPAGALPLLRQPPPSPGPDEHPKAS